MLRRCVPGTTSRHLEALQILEFPFAGVARIAGVAVPVDAVVAAHRIAEHVGETQPQFRAAKQFLRDVDDVRAGHVLAKDRFRQQWVQ
jgi:hypothetical protein